MEGNGKLPRLTDRQLRMLCVIQRYMDGHRGYAPSWRCLQSAMGLASPQAVCSHLTALARKGYVVWEPSASRTLKPTFRLTCYPVTEVAGGKVAETGKFLVKDEQGKWREV